MSAAVRANIQAFENEASSVSAVSSLGCLSNYNELKDLISEDGLPP